MRAEFLPYCKPVLSRDDIAPVVDALQRGWLTSGPAVRDFEEAFARESGVRHAVALNSCTAALHVALRAMGVGPGDDVVMPSLTFVAGAQCTMELGARPVFADIDPDTLSVTRATLEAAVTPDTKVIIPMPYAGRPLDIASIVDFAHARGIRVLEDAAHGCGTLDRGEWPGMRSDAAAFSFYATKNLTSAEGGMLLTNDDTLAARARTLGLHGMDKDAWARYSATGQWRYDVREPGYKYNLSDPLAALGHAQLKRLPDMQHRRRQLAERYRIALSNVPGISLQASPSSPGDQMSWCMFVIRVDEQRAGISRDAMIDALRQANIGTAVHYVPTHLFSGYRSLEMNNLPQTESVWRQLISLPLSPAMSDSDVDDVFEAINSIVASRMYATSYGSTVT